jgi:two-component system, OmpR family, sensor kinase
MSAIGLSRTDHAGSWVNRALLAGWIVSAAVNVVLMYALPGQETVPFHLVWIGLSLVYGFTTWRPLGMCVALGAVSITTGYVLIHHVTAGEIRWEEVTEVPLMTAVFVVMVWHVHRRQQALAEVARLADSDRRRVELQQLFVRFASHELRTPITVARGYTELVRAAADRPSVQEDTAVVLDELDKLARITQRLVTLMQLDGPYPQEIIDVDAELARIVRRWEPTAPRTWRVCSGIGYVPINPERLEAALDCLLENAVKFTGPGDLVEVTGTVGPDAWTVAVADSGIGMTPTRAQALSTGEALPRRTASGTGLGLMIARTVAASWGGDLRLSGQLGEGTTVTLRFPLSHPGQALAGPPPVGRATGPRDHDQAMTGT